MQRAGSGSMSVSAYAAAMPAAVQLLVADSAMRPADGDDRDPRRGGRARHPGGGLAAQRLLVERALPGDDEARAPEMSSKSEQVEEVVDAGPDVGGQEGQRGEPRSAGAAPGCPATPSSGRRRARRPDQAVGVTATAASRARALLEHPHVVGARALLRSVDGGGAVRAEQRVVHVAGDDDTRPRPASASPDVIDLCPGRAGRRRRSGSSRPSASRKRTPSAGGHARAAVGAGAAAEAEHDPPGPASYGVGDQLAGAELVAVRRSSAARAARRAARRSPDASASSTTATLAASPA